MNTNTLQNINVGVDTGKSQLDIYIHPLDIYFTVPNNEKGIKEAVKTIAKHRPNRVVIEATGRLEMPFIFACDKAKLPYVIANPLHVKRFAGAIGRRAKNDRLDAALIAHFGEAIQPKPTTDFTSKSNFFNQTHLNCTQKSNRQGGRKDIKTHRYLP